MCSVIEHLRRMTLPFSPPLEPMLAQAQDAIPDGPGWRYEPKWDGFRCIVFRDNDEVVLSSRESKPLQRYFPELVDQLRARLPARCIIDGEIILPTERGLDFGLLGQRLHPAASRVNKLAAETPTSFVAFDALAVGDDDLRGLPTSARRERLESLIASTPRVFITPQTTERSVAESWFHLFEGAGCDGVIARREETPYSPGQRVMVKIKHGRFADVVVGGFRRERKKQDQVGSLLLGLYDDEGVLHHVGHTSSFSAKEKRELLIKLEPLKGESFHGGRTPEGGQSRWSAGKEQEPWVPLQPVLVCEVRYDYLQGDRFRHATTFQRWRDDRSPQSCTYEQLEPPQPFSLDRLVALAPPPRGA